MPKPPVPGALQRLAPIRQSRHLWQRHSQEPRASLEHSHPRTRLGIKARTPTAMPRIHPSQIPPGLLLCADTAAPKSKGLQWFGAQWVARQPRHPLPVLSAWKWSPLVTPGHHSTPPCRSGYGAVSPLSISSPLPRPALAAGQSPAQSPAGSHLRRSLAAIPGQSSWRYWEEWGSTPRLTRPALAQHCQAPACSPESAVTGRQRRPGCQRSQREGCH